MFRNQFNEDRFVAAVEKFVDAYETLVKTKTQPVASESFEAVLNHLRAGNKINAIKSVRIMTGAGLKEAKDMVDALKVL